MSIIVLSINEDLREAGVWDFVGGPPDFVTLNAQRGAQNIHSAVRHFSIGPLGYSVGGNRFLKNIDI